MQDVDVGEKFKKLDKFKPYLSAQMYKEWKEWIMDFNCTMKAPSSLLKRTYFFNIPAPSTNVTTRSQSELLGLLPRHLPSAKGIENSDISTILNHFQGRNTEGPNIDDNGASNSNSRSGLVIESTYVGRRKKSQQTGLSDCSDIEVGAMVLYLIDPNDRSQIQPFLMAKVLDKCLVTMTYNILWYGPFQQNTEWSKCTWGEWKNTLTQEIFDKFNPEDKQKYSRRIGSSCLPSKEMKRLTSSEIFLHSFALNVTGKIPVVVAKKISRQLNMEDVVTNPHNVPKSLWHDSDFENQ